MNRRSFIRGALVGVSVMAIAAKLKFTEPQYAEFNRGRVTYISETSLEDLIIGIENEVDERGIRIMPKSLIVRGEMRELAEKVLRYG